MIRVPDTPRAVGVVDSYDTDDAREDPEDNVDDGIIDSG